METTLTDSDLEDSFSRIERSLKRFPLYRSARYEELALNVIVRAIRDYCDWKRSAATCEDMRELRKLHAWFLSNDATEKGSFDFWLAVLCLGSSMNSGVHDKLKSYILRQLQLHH